MALLHSGSRPGPPPDRVRPVPGPSTLRVLAVAALGPLLTGYAAVATVLVITTATAAGAYFTTTGVLAAAVPGWLAAHGVPVIIEGRELGALPLLPTLGVAVLVWRTAAAAADRLGVDTPKSAGRVVGVIAGAHAALGLAFALLTASGPTTVDPLAGLYYPALLSAVAATVGVLPRSGLRHTIRERVDPLALRGLKAGLLAVAALLTVGSLLLVAALAASFGTVADLFSGDGAGSGFGLLLLSAGYLPNAVVAATAFASGPGFALGQVTFGPLDFSGGPVPALPLLAALPEHQALWWFALCALPAAVGALVGWALRDAAPTPAGRLRAVAVAAVVVAMVFAVLAGSAGGSLGGGPFHPLDLRAAWLSLAMVVWIGVPGAIVAWTSGPRPVRAPADAHDRDDAEVDDPEDDDPEDDDPEDTDGSDGSDEADEAVEAADEDEPDDVAADGQDSDDTPDHDSGR